MPSGVSGRSGAARLSVGGRHRGQGSDSDDTRGCDSELGVGADSGIPGRSGQLGEEPCELPPLPTRRCRKRDVRSYCPHPSREPPHDAASFRLTGLRARRPPERSLRSPPLEIGLWRVLSSTRLFQTHTHTHTPKDSATKELASWVERKLGAESAQMEELRRELSLVAMMRSDLGTRGGELCRDAMWAGIAGRSGPTDRLGTAKFGLHRGKQRRMLALRGPALMVDLTRGVFPPLDAHLPSRGATGGDPHEPHTCHSGWEGQHFRGPAKPSRPLCSTRPTRRNWARAGSLGTLRASPPVASRRASWPCGEEGGKGVGPSRRNG